MAVEEIYDNSYGREMPRGPTAESESALIDKFVEPDTKTSYKRIVSKKDGKKVVEYKPTKFKELISSDDTTSNLTDQEYELVREIKDLARLLQFTSEMSNGELDLSEAQEYIADQANFILNLAKSKEGENNLLRMSRTSRQITEATERRFQRDLNLPEWKRKKFLGIF